MAFTKLTQDEVNALGIQRNYLDTMTGIFTQPNFTFMDEHINPAKTIFAFNYNTPTGTSFWTLQNRTTNATGDSFAPYDFYTGAP